MREDARKSLEEMWKTREEAYVMLEDARKAREDMREALGQFNCNWQPLSEVVVIMVIKKRKPSEFDGRSTRGRSKYDDAPFVPDKARLAVKTEGRGQAVARRMSREVLLLHLEDLACRSAGRLTEDQMKAMWRLLCQYVDMVSQGEWDIGRMSCWPMESSWGLTYDAPEKRATFQFGF
ncbi:hypothetical protein E2C01_016472 [Portunus trituberculatus]|uniref:Uncharacterized protein n=1 Tax=Portunus trituberculatus TaxID=210409 RepID=A0A5B7DQC8_PORTR|nr:hypothetical protein [Portunus trituberculatus]